jgi:hypothetical protein
MIMSQRFDMPEKRFLTDKELDRNYDAFKGVLPDILREHRGAYVIVRDGKVLDIYQTMKDAYQAGWRQFQDDLFSVQEITDEVVDLGYFSHVDDRWAS